MSKRIAVKKNFYSAGDAGEIAMPPRGEISPVLADEPHLQSRNMETVQEPAYEHSETVDYDDSSDEHSTESVQEVSANVPQVAPAQESFRALREARERAEWERDQYKNQMQEMQKGSSYQQQAQMQTAPVEEPDDFNFDVEDDDLLEGKHAKKLVAELNSMKRQLRKFHSESNETAIDAKIRATFPDFADVVSRQNVDTLNEQYPEIAFSLKSNPDAFNKASAAYSIMKKFGIYKDMSYEEDKMKAIKNSQKPRPVSSVSPQQGDSPLTKANA